MSYSRPPFDAADASWSGAAAYTRPPPDAADATWMVDAPRVEGAVTIQTAAPVPALAGVSGALALSVPAGATVPTTAPIPLVTSTAGALHEFIPYVAPGLILSLDCQLYVPRALECEVWLDAWQPPCFQTVIAAAVIEAPPPSPLVTLAARGHLVQPSGTTIQAPPLVPGAIAVGGLDQDLALPDNAATGAQAPHAPRRASAATGLRDRARQARPTQTRAHAPGQHGLVMGPGCTLAQTDMLRLRRSALLDHGPAIRVPGFADLPHAETLRHRESARLPQRESIRIRAGAAVAHAEQIRTRNRLFDAHAQAAIAPLRLSLPQARQAGIAHARLHAGQQQMMWPLPGRWSPCYSAPPLGGLLLICSPATPLSEPVQLGLCCHWTQPREPWTAPDGRFVIPSRPFYMRIHDLSVVRLPDRTELPWRSINLRHDTSQWAWTMSLELMGRDAASLIDPGAGDVVQVEITINGATWICLAEDWTESSAHGQWTTTTVTGRSLTALLSDRYQPPRHYTEAEARTMAQLADQELPISGEWSLTWEPLDWLVPAGAWSYQDLSPIRAIAALAADAGALVYAEPDDKVITVRPVYRMLPWAYSAGSEDLVVPESALVGALSRRYRYPDQANAVHVYGAEIGGIQGRVYRAGSAGDVYAADRASALMTHVDGARALGGRILAGLATPPGIASFTLPVDARSDFPVVKLGDWARVELSEGAEAGPVTSIQVSVSSDGDGTSVRQTLALGETANDYQRLLALIPTEPRILAQISAVGSGTATVSTLGGGLLRVRGTGGVGDWVWCRGGRIEDPAPTMAAYDVDV